MRAMVLDRTAEVVTDPLVLREVTVPKPVEAQVRIKVHVCGVCRTDLHVVEGELPEAKRPLIPGHQVVGVIDDVGRRVKDFKVGDRVGIA